LKRILISIGRGVFRVPVERNRRISRELTVIP